MVRDWIITTCMEELLVAPKGRLPAEDSVEAVCELITTAGGRLAKAERPETRKKLDEVMRGLDRLALEKGVPPRVRFIIKDLGDLRRANWVPRRETFTAKKLDEVRAQAEAELGMIPSNIAAILPTLPVQQRIVSGGGGGGERRQCVCVCVDDGKGSAPEMWWVVVDARAGPWAHAPPSRHLLFP